MGARRRQRASGVEVEASGSREAGTEIVASLQTTGARRVLYKLFTNPIPW